MKKNGRILFLCWLVYTVAYLGRSGYNANISPISNFYGVTNAVAGIVGTCFFFAYGGGQFLHGMLCRFYPKRWTISAALLVCSGVNLIIFLQPPFAIYKYIWFLNGAILSLLWPSLTLILSDYQEELGAGKISMFMSTSHVTGTILSYLLGALFNLRGGYRYTFLFAAVATLLVSVIWFFAYPQYEKAGAPSLPDPAKKKVRRKGSLFEKGTVLLFLTLGFSAVLHKLVMDGSSSWAPKILTDQYAMSDSASILLSLVLPIFGLFGTFLAVQITNRFRNDLLVSGVLFLIGTGLTAVLLAMVQSSDTSWKTASLFVICFGIVYCLMESINSLLTVIIPLRMGAKSGMTTGILNGCCYIGSAISSYTLGAVSDAGGWSAVFLLLTIVLAVSAVVVFAVAALLHEKKTIY